MAARLIAARTRCLGALLGAALAGATSLASAQTAPGPRGFAPSSVAAERAAERVALASPSESAAAHHETALASYVHRMGSPGDYRTAAYVRDVLTRAGWDARLVEYDVPIVVPDVESLALLDPAPHELDLYEAAIPGDAWSNDHAAIGKPYSGYSADGDATGALVYANYARPEDFDVLAKAGIDVRGAIVVARAGKMTLTGKAFEAARRGASATLVFNDPMDGGYFKGDPYPRGPWRPTSAATRNTMTFANTPGDPTAIGIPVPGAPHKPLASLLVPAIPEAPITADVALRLIDAMGGPVAPPEWHGGFAAPLHLGGRGRAHFVLHATRRIGPIWDVVAKLAGTTPGTVVVGGHRDAWTYGAVDPISGTVDLLQLGEALGKAVRTGWRPRRTVIIGSWDGEELNLFGSAIWVDQNDAELRAQCAGYVNTDEVAYGPTFEPYATPDLAGLFRDAASDVRAPDGTMLDVYWSASDPKRVVDEPGGGSDHEAFVFREGLPGGGAGFGGPFGTYHSAYDDLASLAVFDPGMHRAAAAARFTTLVTLRLADANVPDLRLSDVADALRGRLDAFAAVDATPRRADVVARLRPDVAAFAALATALDARVDAAVAAGDDAAASAAYARVRAVEAAFVDPAGIGKLRWARSRLFGEDLVPTLDATLDAQAGDVALDALDAAFRRAVSSGT